MDAFRDNKPGRIINMLIKDFGFYFSISLGLFIFILFFQPFPIDHFDFNNGLLFTAGQAAIILLVIIFVRNILPSFFSRRPDPVLPNYFDSIIMLIFSSLAIAFFLRYVGGINISFFIMSKVIFICLVPPAVIRVGDIIRGLKDANKSLGDEKLKIEMKAEQYKEEYLNKTMDFALEGQGRSLSLLISDIAFIKSADNYVEIVYIEGDVYKRQLIRTTLKNIEQMLKPYEDFLRCHRICIVNRNFIDKLSRKFNNHILFIRGYDEQIPVSRQYLVGIREAIR
jgi:hypothetical protein